MEGKVPTATKSIRPLAKYEIIKFQLTFWRSSTNLRGFVRKSSESQPANHRRIQFAE